MSERVWGAGLSPIQADGRACVVCGRGLRVRGSVAVPVGRSSVTGSQVFACTGACAERAGELGPAARLVAVPPHAWAAAGAAFVAALDWAGGDVRRAWPDDLVEAAVHAAAPLIVAAELRQLAQQIEGDARGYLRLRARADELDPAGADR
ncbi:MAG: hypothetical protein ACRDSF_01995 [Pseudonocardiaceae bacterium]